MTFPDRLIKKLLRVISPLVVTDFLVFCDSYFRLLGNSCVKHLGPFGHKLWGKEEELSVKDSRKVEAESGGMQVGCSVGRQCAGVRMRAHSLCPCLGWDVGSVTVSLLGTGCGLPCHVFVQDGVRAHDGMLAPSGWDADSVTVSLLGLGCGLLHSVFALPLGPKGEAGKAVPLPGPPGTQGLPGSPGFPGPQGTLSALVCPKITIRIVAGFSHPDCWSCSQQVTEVFLEPQEGRACQERRALLASPESDFQGPLAPKVSLQDKPAPEWGHCSAHSPLRPPLSPPFPGWLSLRAVAVLFLLINHSREEAMHVNTLFELVTSPSGELAEAWRTVNAVANAVGVSREGLRRQDPAAAREASRSHISGLSPHQCRRHTEQPGPVPGWVWIRGKGAGEYEGGGFSLRG